MLDGFKFIWNDRLFRYIMIVALFINMLESAKYSVIMPFYTQTFFGEALDLGLLVAVSGGGSVVGALVFGAGLAVLAVLYFTTKVSRVFLFWAAFILTRPLGATVGDWFDKPVAKGGLEFSRPLASLVLAIVIVALIMILPQRAGRHGEAKVSA